MSARETLVAAYERPEEVAARFPGRVVGYLGADVPRGLVEAAGLLPLRLRGLGPTSTRAEAILGPGVDPAVRLVLADLLERRTPVDFLLLSHGSDSLVRLYTSLRVLSDPLPEVWFLDLLHLPTETTAAYNRARVEELRGVLGRWSGQPVEAEAPGARPELLAGVADLRRAGRLSGPDALAVLGAGEILPTPEYEALLEQFLREEHAPVPAGRRVYVTGSEQVSREAYRSLEADGVQVVGEDRLRLRGTNERAAHTAREAKAAGAEAVLAWIRAGDESFAWGLPALRRALDVPLEVVGE